MSAHLHIIRLTGAASLQDGGRRGFLRFGLSASGPMDPLAFAAANRLVGNPADAAALELGLAAASLRVEGGAVRLALAGAPSGLRLDGEPLAAHRSFVLREGSALTVERPREGVFAYLAAAGGFPIRSVMGSRALHQRAALGGLDGRPCREGDRLPLAAPASYEADHGLDPIPLEREAPIRVVLGPQDDLFSQAGLATFLAETFTVSNRADRMGYQLDGPEIAHGAGGFNIVSDATVAGSVQVPGSGRPIVLLADRQTTGGYPKIATVISADLRRIAQRRPGEPVRFAAVDLATATRLAREAAGRIAALDTRLRPVEGEAERLMAANLAGAAVDALRAED
ncbi:biotin-dependent carboxyltransferase family protein [Methylorubrum extorquens]|uniref:Urea amidolyase related protein n=1 Tax=Methylorubrum extorquens (strain CM4 / NCIMB 13688) TaxID=440085 RepID=B7KV07_METC4|nr:biotin-dependent carboxyltransferase family protein [Methylorubrum extorquens]ACK82678.1 urea amidolyase related protein [Methylorubrum extorquens CM4]